MKTHYDVLNLDKNCTPKEIKDSFITLSKKYHPDKNKSKEAHKKFVEVNEAYSVLGKAFSRQIYDESLPNRKPTFGHGQYSECRHETIIKTPYEEYAARYAEHAKKYRGVNDPTNIKARGLLICFIFVAFGTVLHLSVMKKSIMHSHHVALQFRHARLQESQYREKRNAKLKEESEKENVGEQ